MRTPTPLRMARIAKGYSLASLVAALRKAGARPVSVTYLHDWETGVRPVPASVAPMLARALGLRRLPR